MNSHLSTYIDEKIINLLIQVEKIRTKIDIYRNISPQFQRSFIECQKKWHHDYIFEKEEDKPASKQVLDSYLYLAEKIDDGNSISIDDILISHEKMYHQVSGKAGYFRKKSMSRNILSHTHHLEDIDSIRPMLANMLSRLQSHPIESPLIKGLIAWYSFEQVSPFSIGTTPFAQMISSLVYRQFNFTILPINSHIKNHKKKYYKHIFSEEEDLRNFITFALEGYLHIQLKFISQLENQSQIKKKTKKLPLRRYEILQIIKDHRLVSFDFIQRRFVGVSGRLLRYDLKKLQDSDLILKRGVTKGVLYQLAE